jgi:hypothetical protein
VAILVLAVGCANNLANTDARTEDSRDDEASGAVSATWKLIPGSGPHGALNTGTRGGFYPQLAFWDGRLYNTWYEQADGIRRIRVAALSITVAGREWRAVDDGPDQGVNRYSSRDAFWSRLLVHDDALYAYWHEELGNDAWTIRVASYNGDDTAPAWSYIDGPVLGPATSGPAPSGPNMIAPGARSSDYASLASFDGGLYAAWRSSNGSAYQIRVARFNDDFADPAWVLVDRGDAGINRDTSMDAYYPKLHVHAGKLYAAWYERNGVARQLRVAVYNGDDAAPAWHMVDGDRTEGLNYEPRNGARGPQLLTHGGTLHAVWYEVHGALGGTVRVASYNGEDSSPGWHFRDGGRPRGMNRSPDGSGWWARAASSCSELVVAWSENDAGTYVIHAAATAELSTAGTEGAVDPAAASGWQNVDPGGSLNVSPASTAEYPHLVSDGESFYLTWSERHDGVFRVFVREGTLQ